MTDLLNACKKNDIMKFITLAQNASKEELSSCLEIASNLKIVKTIIEKYKVFDGITKCYENAVLYDYIHIVDYIEVMHTKYVMNLIKPKYTPKYEPSYSEDGYNA